MTKQPSTSGQEYYQIRVKGRLGKQWSDWLGDMTVTSERGVTALTGPVADQAALYGILKLMHDLRMPLISVNKIRPDQEEGSINL